MSIKKMEATKVEQKDESVQTENLLNESREDELKRKCKHWNRGFCREGSDCKWYHSECEKHLEGQRYCNRHCHKIHRNACKYWRSRKGCFRGDQCQYLHKEIRKNVDNVKGLKRKSNLSSNENQQERYYKKSYFDESKTERDEEIKQSLFDKDN